MNIYILLLRGAIFPLHSQWTVAVQLMYNWGHSHYHLLETSVWIQLEKYLIDNNLLNEYQTEFRKSYSTDTGLINLMDTIKIENYHGVYAEMVLLDLQRVFDNVDHDILCKQFQNYGLKFYLFFQIISKGQNSNSNSI